MTTNAKLVSNASSLETYDSEVSLHPRESKKYYDNKYGETNILTLTSPINVELPMRVFDGYLPDGANPQDLLINEDASSASSLSQGGFLKTDRLGIKFVGDELPITIFSPKRIVNVRIYWGDAIDAIRIDNGTFIFDRNAQGEIDELNKNNYGVRVFEKTLFGRQTSNFTDFPLRPGESIVSFNVKCGDWIDSIQIVTNTNRVSPMFGSTTGGGFAQLKPPGDQYEIVGFHGSLKQWIRSLGLIYVER